MKRVPVNTKDAETLARMAARAAARGRLDTAARYYMDAAHIMRDAAVIIREERTTK